MRQQKLAKSDAALLDIRKALERAWPLRRRLAVKANAWVQANVPKHERAKFKSFLLTVLHLGNVDLEKARRRVGATKELLDKWTDTLEISKFVNRFLNTGRRLRAFSFMCWAKLLSKKGDPTVTNPDRRDRIDYGNMLPLAKYAAQAFDRPEVFKPVIDCALTMHECGGLSSTRRFFIDLGKCLSHGIRGGRGIDPTLWDKLDFEIADIILSHDPPISDKDAVHQLQNRGYLLRGHLATLEVRFRRRKHRLLLDAWPAVLSRVK